MLRFTIVAMVAVAIVWSLATADGPEAADAQNLGAARVERAQKLATDNSVGVTYGGRW